MYSHKEVIFDSEMNINAFIVHQIYYIYYLILLLK